MERKPRFKFRKLFAVLAITIGLIMTGVGVTYAVLTYQRTFTVTGTPNIAGLSLWLNEARTQPALDSLFALGAVDPDSTEVVSFYVYNNGTVPLQLSQVLSDWSPSGYSSLITVTWNREGLVLNPGSQVQATVTIQIGLISEAFSFKWKISGTES